MKKEILLGIAAFSMLIASCGGGKSEDTSGADTTKTDSTPVVVENVYSVDTAASLVSWKSYGKLNDTTNYHLGSLKLESGSITTQDSAGTANVTAGELVFNMASVTESKGEMKLVDHLKSAEFFDIAQFATSTFTFESFDGTTATGSLSLTGKTVAVSAPAVITITPESVNVEVSMFLVDFLAMEMPFFVEDAKQKPAKQHNPKVEVTATIVAVKL